MKITDQFIDRAKPGSYKDDVQNGLYLTIGKKKITWYCITWAKTKTVREKIGTYPEINTRTARRLVKEVVARAAMNTNTYNPKTLNQIFSAWEKIKNKKSMLKDQQNYRNHLAQWGSRLLSDISRADVINLKNAMSDKPVAFNRSLTLLASLYKFAAINFDYEAKNPCCGTLKYPENPRRVVMDIAHAEDFFRALDDPKTPDTARDIIYLLIYVGLRPGEAFGLKKSWVNWQTGVLTIPAAETKTGNEYISVLPDEVLGRLKKRMDLPGEYFFPPSRKPNEGSVAINPHVTSIRYAISGVCRRAGIPDIHPHDLRRTYGTWQLNAGVSIEVVSKNLHHSNIGITQKVYADVLINKQREGANAVRDLIDGIRKK